MLQPFNGFFLDLPDPFPGEVKFFPDLFQGMRVLPVEAKVQPDDAGLPLFSEGGAAFGPTSGGSDLSSCVADADGMTIQPSGLTKTRKGSRREGARRGATDRWMQPTHREDPRG